MSAIGGKAETPLIRSVLVQAHFAGGSDGGARGSTGLTVGLADGAGFDHDLSMTDDDRNPLSVDTLMLRFLAKSLWWAGSWPLGMWLLALDKSASEATKDFEPPSRTNVQNRRQAEQQHAAKSNDAIAKPEIPEPLRGMLKLSIEQAKRAFDTFWR